MFLNARTEKRFFSTSDTDIAANDMSGGIRRRAAALELDLLQVGLRWETSRLVARVDELFVDDDVELTCLALLDVNRPAPASFKTSLHTEGFRFVASMRAVKNEDRHGRCLVRGNLVQPQRGSLSAAPGRLQCWCRGYGGERYFSPKTSIATRPALTAHGQPALA